ncbi:hypothetical protein MPLB_230004 [Mesorhizobium sp. ORS 3324]|nr:hypothetical protein MPLB_230004 [Mesorhizobium sp. ORS 3324]
MKATNERARKRMDLCCKGAAKVTARRILTQWLKGAGLMVNKWLILQVEAVKELARLSFVAGRSQGCRRSWSAAARSAMNRSQGDRLAAAESERDPSPEAAQDKAHR